MSILIKGMEMPTSCSGCQLERHQDTAYDFEFRCCPVTGEQTNRYLKDRAPRCPLVPIPPHGRLIDADDTENITVIMNENGSGFNRIIAPIIIEAEEGET